MKKKLFTMALAVCLVMGMSVSVFAYTPGSTNNITGDDVTSHDTGDDGIADGKAGIADTETGTKSDINLKVTIGDGDKDTYTEVIAADVNTSELTFTYKPKTRAMVWDPVQLKYIPTEAPKGEGTWTANDQTITVTSYSSVAVTVTGTLPTSATNNVLFTFVGDTNSCNLGSASNGHDKPGGTAQSGTLTVHAAASGGEPTAIDTEAKMTIAIKKQ